MTSNTSALRQLRVGAVLAAALCATSPAWAVQPSKTFVEMVDKFALVPPGEHNSDVLAKATEALGFIKRMALPEAHLAVNAALQLDARNSYLHFLNGFVYHLQARQGDTQKSEMAIEGYQQALRLDPGNWIAQEFLGLAHLELKQFDRAKTAFSGVLLMNAESSVSIYGLMVASYLTGDAASACGMAEQLRKASPQFHPGFVRSSISVYAACGQFEQAGRMRDAWRALNGHGPEAERLDQRLSQWKAFYRRHGKDGADAGQASAPGLMRASLTEAGADARPMQLAQAFKVPSQVNARPEPDPVVPTEVTPSPAPVALRPDGASDPAGPRMILIDVVLLSTQELVSTSKGINLLNALTLQLGSTVGNIAAYSRVTSSNAHNAPADVSTAITRAVTIPALSYSMNIVNANSAMNEVLARPTLAAIEGLPSEFFSGTNLSAGVVSTSQQGGTTIVPLDKRFGIKLAVTPTFLPQGQVQIKVDAQRTSLNASSDNPRVAYQIEMAEITANANVVMKLGETLVLSGLSEKSSARTRDGVPVLQDMPLVQYLFSNKKTTDIQRSVLILITPRSPQKIAETDGETARASSIDMEALREKFGFEARIPTNVDAILTRLEPNDFFRQFRQGDVSMERWDRMETTGDRLQQAMGFLYY